MGGEPWDLRPQHRLKGHPLSKGPSPPGWIRSPRPHPAWPLPGGGDASPAAGVPPPGGPPGLCGGTRTSGLGAVAVAWTPSPPGVSWAQGGCASEVSRHRFRCHPAASASPSGVGRGYTGEMGGPLRPPLRLAPTPSKWKRVNSFPFLFFLFQQRSLSTDLPSFRL